MSAESVGQIGLDLVVNKNDFEKQMGGVQNLAKKAGKALAAAFAVKKLVSFGAACIELGSDLQEVQNVVDVTFPSMSKKVDEFAQNAAASFGLSETMAKKFTGTFGAMAKAFGFSESAAYDMSTTLTGLAGDVASFYNITQDEAYTKLKSVFTGETESLKDLGVVMTQTALDSYALANGFGKTTAKMTEAEKVALRYKFVQEQLTGASGDFIRTSDGWANQVRVLKLQFDSLKATIGQGLINVLTPVIKVINTLVGKLMTLANAFKSFTEMITGKKGTGDAAAQMQSTAKAADGAAASTKAVGDAAAESAKKMKGLFAFDDMNVMSGDEEKGSSGDVSGGYDVDSFNLTGVQSASEEIGKQISGIADDFVQQFKSGIEKIDFSSIEKNFSRIVGKLPSIARTSVKNMQTIAKPFAGWIGNMLGNAVAISAEMIDIGLAGVADYLDQNVDRINDWSEKVSKAVGKGFSNLTSISENISNAVLGGLENARPALEQGINDLLTGFSDFGMSIGTIYSDAFEIATGKIAEWTSQNSELMQSTIADFLSLGGEACSLIGKIVGDIGNSLSSWWNDSGSAIFEGIIGAWLDFKTVVLELWNEVLMPVLENLKNEVSDLWNSHLKPLWDSILEFVSSVGEFLLMLWNQEIMPIVSYLIDTFGPTVKSIANIIVGVVKTVFGAVSDIIKGILKVLGGLLDFITGIFTGNWEKAWDGIRKIIEGIWDAIWGTIKGVINLIIDGVNALISLVYGALRAVVNGIGNIAGTIGDIVGKDWHFSIPDDPPQIPKLASGGYVKANTPQLAMIGDNMHQGEIVAPEDKMYQISAQAMKDVMQQFMSALAAMLNSSQGREMTLVFKVTGEMAPFVRLLKAELDKEANRAGVDFKVVYE